MGFLKFVMPKQVFPMQLTLMFSSVYNDTMILRCISEVFPMLRKIADSGSELILIYDFHGISEICHAKASFTDGTHINVFSSIK